MESFCAFRSVFSREGYHVKNFKTCRPALGSYTLASILEPRNKYSISSTSCPLKKQVVASKKTSSVVEAKSTLNLEFLAWWPDVFGWGNHLGLVFPKRCRIMKKAAHGVIFHGKHSQRMISCVICIQFFKQPEVLLRNLCFMKPSNHHKKKSREDKSTREKKSSEIRKMRTVFLRQVEKVQNRTEKIREGQI